MLTLIGVLLSIAHQENAARPNPLASEPDAIEIVRFPADWIRPVNAALKDFRKSHDNYRCYNLMLIRHPKVLEVTFSSPPITSEDTKTGIITIGPRLKCGTGATYIMRMDGRLVRKGH